MATETALSRLSEKIEGYLHRLCITISDRSVGSPGNKEATRYFSETIQRFGFETECPEFDCIDWTYGDVLLKAGRESFAAHVGPYSLGCDLKAPLIEASTLQELEKADIHEKIVLLHGEIAQEQIMPKNFPFYNPEGHQRLIALLEQKEPAAIIAATGQNPEMVGAQYPFPLFEDGDFDVPSVYMRDVDGQRLKAHSSEIVSLRSESKRVPSKGSNVVARKGDCRESRIVFLAHIDARKGSPGALDNSGGTATLLALAELLEDYSGSPGIEIVAFNGEDYYSAPGQQQYLKQHKKTLKRIVAAVNLDDVGYRKGRTGISFYECPDSIAARLRNTFNHRESFFEGQQWFQGDHMIFALQPIPAVAFISEKAEYLMKEIVHTERDTVDLVDCDKLAEAAHVLRDIAVTMSDVSHLT